MIICNSFRTDDTAIISPESALVTERARNQLELVFSIDLMV